MLTVTKPEHAWSLVVPITHYFQYIFQVSLAIVHLTLRYQGESDISTTMIVRSPPNLKIAPHEITAQDFLYIDWSHFGVLSTEQQSDHPL